MAHALVAGDLYTMTVATYQSDQLGLNVRQYVVDSVTGGTVNDQNMAETFDAGLAPLYKAYLGTDAVFYGVRVGKFLPLPPTYPQFSTAHTGAGTGGAQSLPGQVSGIITLETDFAGRGYRGRVYLPFPSRSLDDATVNRPSDAALDLFNAIGTYLTGTRVLTSGGSTAVLKPILWHAEDGDYTPINNSDARQAWATQKRRGNYGRPNEIPPW